MLQRHQQRIPNDCGEAGTCEDASVISRRLGESVVKCVVGYGGLELVSALSPQSRICSQCRLEEGNADPWDHGLEMWSAFGFRIVLALQSAQK